MLAGQQVLVIVCGPDKMQNAEPPAYDTFYNKPSGSSLLEAENTVTLHLVRNGMTADEVVVKLELLKPPLTESKTMKTVEK